MKLWQGIAAFVVLMGLAAWLVFAKVIGPEAFVGPVGLFVGWLIRQPVEMRKPDEPKGKANVNGVDQMPETEPQSHETD